MTDGKTMKIIGVEIQEDGDFVRIETNREDDYHYIFLRAEDLPDLANLSENL